MFTRSCVYTLIFGVFFTMVLAAAAATPELKEIMQGLRADTAEIADGLLTDDFAQVARGAGNIAGHARIPPQQVRLVAAELGAEMAAFKQFDNRVHDLSLSIVAAANKKDRERAIADYHRMLDGCFDCHAAYKTRVAAVLSDAVEGE